MEALCKNQFAWSIQIESKISRDPKARESLKKSRNNRINKIKFQQTL